MKTPRYPAASRVLAPAAIALWLLAGSVPAHANNGIPNGTFTYTLKVTGQGLETGDDGYRRQAHIHWVVKGRLRMLGSWGAMLDHPRQVQHQGEAAAADLAGMRKAIAACGDNEACTEAAAFHYTATHMAQMKKARHDAPTPAFHQHDPTWVSTRQGCQVTAVVHDSETETGTDVGEGYSRKYNHHGVRTANHTFSCVRDLRPIEIKGDSPAHRYQLTVPWIAIPASVSGDSAPETHASIEQKDFVVTGAQLHPVDDVQHGSKTFHRKLASSPVYGRSLGIPLTATLTWTFTPGQHWARRAR